MTSEVRFNERSRTTAWRAGTIGVVGAWLLVLVGGCATPGAAPTPTTAPAAAAAAAPQAAPKPGDATLKIQSPTAGQSVPAGALKVSINYTGPTLVPAADAKKLDDYHLHYFLDEDATQYIGAPKAIPAGNPKIVHSAAKEVTFDNVTAGSHTVAVVMSGNNHISVTPALSDTLTFTVQ